MGNGFYGGGASLSPMPMTRARISTKKIAPVACKSQTNALAITSTFADPFKQSIVHAGLQSDSLPWQSENDPGRVRQQ